MDEAVDPTGPERGSLRLLRGGGWDNDETYCRTAFRRTLSPSFRANGVGFRIALSPSSQLAEPGKVELAEASGARTEGASAEQRPRFDTNHKRWPSTTGAEQMPCCGQS